MRVVFYGKHFYGVDKQWFNITYTTGGDTDYMIQCKLNDWKKKNGYSKAWYSLDI